jgi:hypothetical protein
LFLDGFLMPVKELVNGISIVPALPADTDVIEYFHILLDTHEAVLAEGAAAETCLLGHRGHEDSTDEIDKQLSADCGNLPLRGRPCGEERGIDWKSRQAA